MTFIGFFLNAIALNSTHDAIPLAGFRSITFDLGGVGWLLNSAVLTLLLQHSAAMKHSGIMLCNKSMTIAIVYIMQSVVAIAILQ